IFDLNARADEGIGGNPHMVADGQAGTHQREVGRVVVVRSSAQMAVLRDYRIMTNGDLPKVIHFDAPRDHGMVTDLEQPRRHNADGWEYLDVLSDVCPHRAQDEIAPPIEQAW